MELVILIGLQAAGKSTFCRGRFGETHVYVSMDLLREKKSKKPRARQLVLIEEALRSGKSVVVDNTNVTRADRAPLIELGKRYGARIIGYFFDLPTPLCLKRNEDRDSRAKVPPTAIYATARKLQRPVIEEGLDQLTTAQD